MNDPLTIRYKHTGFIFQINPYYNPIPVMGSIESPITGEPQMPENPGW